MGERDPGNKGDRIPFVYINVKEQKGVKLRDKKWNIHFIRENNLKINYKFYITNQLMKPIIQILELCLKNPEDFRNILNKLDREVMGCKDISSYFK